jgi:hypothetical protein
MAGSQPHGKAGHERDRSERTEQETGIDLRVLSRCTHVAGNLQPDAETDGSERLGKSLVTRRAHRRRKVYPTTTDALTTPGGSRPVAVLACLQQFK